MDKLERKRIDSDRRKMIGERIREERKRTINPEYSNGRCYSQEEFAKRLGITKQAYNNLENGVGAEPKLEYLYQIKAECGCDIGYLIGEYDCRTRQATDICTATGLSEDAVNNLTSTTTDFFDKFITLSMGIPTSLYSTFIKLKHLKTKEEQYKECFCEEMRDLFERAYSKVQKECEKSPTATYNLRERYREILRELLQKKSDEEIFTLVSDGCNCDESQCELFNIASDYKEIVTPHSCSPTYPPSEVFVSAFAIQSWDYLDEIYNSVPALKYTLVKQFDTITSTILND